MTVRICIFCKKEYGARFEYKWRRQKYCSLGCKEKDWINAIRPYMRNNPGLKGEKNPAWKGNGVGYHGIHKWIIRQLGNRQKCDHCGDTSERRYEWANKDHRYERKLSDWMRLCTSCHRKYDRKMNL